jgi:hypothetical protein
MASFTGVGDELILAVADKGETVAIALSGTYNMIIKFQLESGGVGSGAWNTIKTVSTSADATIAEDYITKSYNERVRLIVTTDTSGTCVATLTDTSNLDVKTFKDRVGNALMTLTQKFTKIHGGIVRTGSGAVVNTTVLLTLTEEAHAGRIVTANHTTGFAITLPEATATGNVYTIFYGTTVGSGSHTIVAPSSSTSFIGGCSISTDIAGVSIICNSADDTITMNGGTTGGLLGTWFRFTDVASGIFMLEGFLCSTGSEADPFSAAV